jgi:tetratricopeptide (TPR) repeat protein
MFSWAEQPEMDSLFNLLHSPSLKQAARIRVKIKLSECFSKFNQVEAYREIDEALALCDEQKNEALKAEVLGQLGVLLYQNSLYDSSIYTFKRVIAISEKEKLPAPMVHAYMNIANNYLDLTRFNLALDYSIRALNLCRKLPDHERLEASILANIAFVYSDQKQFDKAIAYLKYRLSIVNKSGKNEDERAVAYLEVANAYQSAKENKFAKKYIDSASNFLVKCEDRYTFYLFHQLLGDIAFDDTLYTLAEKHFEQAIIEARKINYSLGLAYVLARSGENYMKIKKIPLAEASFKEAILLGQSMRKYDVIASTEKELGNLYLSKGMALEAAKHFKLHSEYTDSILENEKNTLTVEMQTRFELQEKSFKLEQVKMGKDQEIEIQRIYIIVSIVLAIIFMCFAVFEFFRYRNKKRVNHQLILLNEEILIQKDELHQQTLALSGLSKEIEEKNRLLEHENEEKSVQLVEYAFYNAHGLRSSVSSIMGLINIINHKFHEQEEMDRIIEMLGMSTKSLDYMLTDFGKKLVAHKYKGNVE